MGKGQKRGRKKEAIVTTVYTIARNLRTAQDVVDSFFQQNEDDKQNNLSPPKPKNKHIGATLDGKETALTRLAQQVGSRRGPHIQHKVALADGCPALQMQLKEKFPDFTLILDFVHANEYLWKVANSLLGEDNKRRTKWVTKQTLLMLSGKTIQIIGDFRSRAEKPSRTKKQVEKLTQTADYFERNLPYMAYDTYLANGWPIASGVIEGACRHFVKDRFELSGMRWQQSGAESLLCLRAIAENEDWDDYHLFRRQQRHQRLYTFPFPTQNSLETQALQLSSQTTPQLKDLNSAKRVPMNERQSHTVENVTLAPSSDYYALPIAT